jgi:hypothetical protein
MPTLRPYIHTLHLWVEGLVRWSGFSFKWLVNFEKENDNNIVTSSKNAYLSIEQFTPAKSFKNSSDLPIVQKLVNSIEITKWEQNWYEKQEQCLEIFG